MKPTEKRTRMAYPFELRVLAVTLFESGLTAAQVAREIGVSTPLAYVWREQYTRGVLTEIKHGRKKYDVETKHQVVTEALAGVPPLEIAAKYSVSAQQLVDSWVRKYQAEGIEGLKEKKRGRPGKPAA